MKRLYDIPARVRYRRLLDAEDKANWKRLHPKRVRDSRYKVNYICKKCEQKVARAETCHYCGRPVYLIYREIPRKGSRRWRKIRKLNLRRAVLGL